MSKKNPSVSEYRDLIKELRNQIAIGREDRAGREAIFSSIGEGLITTDDKGYITQINQIALDILGYSKKELIGKWFTEAILAFNEDGSQTPTVDRPITQAFITGRPISNRTYYKNKNGSLIPVYLTVSPILLRKRPVGAIEIFRDISLEIENDKLKTEFISIASHQLRTPLSSINTYSHMLAEGYAGELGEGQLSFMKIILSASNRMNELISTLLNVTRVEAGNITVKSVPISLESVVQETVKELMPQIRNKGLKINVKIEESLPLINTDPLIIREIFTNLVSNSIKYTPNGGIIDISLLSTLTAITFCVKDNGYGIPLKSQSRIFTKFYRAANASQFEPTGTGLGLYLIKLLSEMINGEIWFKSRENKGSSFYFSISKQGSIAKEARFGLESRDY